MELDAFKVPGTLKVPGTYFMKLGLLNKETWIFLDALREHFAGLYDVRVFEPTPYPLPILKDQLAFRWFKRQLSQFLQDCDVAFFEWASEYVIEATHLPISTPIVTRLHRYEMFKWVDRINWERVSYVILDTEAMRQKLLKQTNLSPERAIVIRPMPIDPARMVYESRPIAGNIGTLCNLIPRKRVYEFILAFHALRAHQPDLHLHIGGPPRGSAPEYPDALAHLVERLGLQDAVTFHGRVEERWSWYQMLDIFVSYSHSEGMQVAPIEAGAAGCYVMSHWWEGADEIFPAGQRFITEAEFVQKANAYLTADYEARTAMRQHTLSFIHRECQQAIINEQVQAIVEKAYRER